MMGFLYRRTEIQGGKQCKNVCLNKCDQQLQKRHEDRKENCQNRCAVTHSRIYGSENKYQAEKTDGDNMPRGNVGKQTNHQHNRLGKHSYQLDERHQRKRKLEPPWNTGRINDVHPVIFVGAECGDEKCEHRQNQRHGDVTRNIGAEREKRD